MKCFSTYIINFHDCTTAPCSAQKWPLQMKYMRFQIFISFTCLWPHISELLWKKSRNKTPFENVLLCIWKQDSVILESSPLRYTLQHHFDTGYYDFYYDCDPMFIISNDLELQACNCRQIFTYSRGLWFSLEKIPNDF